MSSALNSWLAAATFRTPSSRPLLKLQTVVVAALFWLHSYPTGTRASPRIDPPIGPNYRLRLFLLEPHSRSCIRVCQAEIVSSTPCRQGSWTYPPFPLNANSRQMCNRGRTFLRSTAHISRLPDVVTIRATYDYLFQPQCFCVVFRKKEDRDSPVHLTAGCVTFEE